MKTPASRFTLASLIAISFALSHPLHAAETVEIKLATLIPNGASAHQSLLEMRDAWQKTSLQPVKMTIFPGGVSGDEQALIKKIRARQLNASLVSVVGLAEIDPAVTCLQLMPMMFRTWDEVDYVREKIRPELESRLREKGFEVLFWADAGWVRYFSKDPGVTPADFKKMKMFVWAGNPEQMKIMRALDCKAVGLSTGEILSGLSTGMIETVPMPAVMALALQINKPAPHMLELNWAPIVGACIVRRDTWELVSPAAQKQFLKIASETGSKMRKFSRSEDDEAVASMQKRGLKVQPVNSQTEAQWQALAAQAYPMIRGKMVPADLFDKVQSHLNEFRAANKQAKP